MINKTNVCYFPTTIMLVDDNMNFLSSLSHELFSRNITNIFFNDCDEAFKTIRDYKKAFSFMSEVLIHPHDDNSRKINIGIDLHAIHKTVYNPNRFRELSVIVVDYAMPRLNGLEFCSKLKQFPVKKILLTGEADESIAVAAFNDQIIDKYVRKDANNFLNIIENIIKDLEKEYFFKTTQIIFDSLINKPDSPNHSLIDPIFVEFFNDLLIRNKIVEYYLLDNTGSFLLIDIYGTPNWLIVKGDDDFKSYSEIAEQGAAPASVIDALKYKKMLPFFFSESDYNVHPTNWEKYLHTAVILKGRQNYYYSYIKNNTYSTSFLPKIRSYQQFITNNLKF